MYHIAYLTDSPFRMDRMSTTHKRNRLDWSEQELTTNRASLVRRIFYASFAKILKGSFNEYRETHLWSSMYPTLRQTLQVLQWKKSIPRPFPTRHNLNMHWTSLDSPPVSISLPTVITVKYTLARMVIVKFTRWTIIAGQRLLTCATALLDRLYIATIHADHLLRFLSKSAYSMNCSMLPHHFDTWEIDGPLSRHGTNDMWKCGYSKQTRRHILSEQAALIEITRVLWGGTHHVMLAS